MFRPMQQRKFTSWEDMERLWHHAFFNELKIAPEEHPVLLSQPALLQADTKEKIMQLMFETFSVPSFYSEVQAALGLFASGRTIGIGVDSGEGATHTVPVYEGYTCVHAINTLNFSGNELTSYLRDLLDSRGYSFTTPKEIDVVQTIKERLCYISEDFQAETAGQNENSHADTMYTLPDGHTILVTGERFQAPEALFQPDLYGILDDGVHHKVYQSVMKCDQDIRKELYDNILLIGGTTLLPGLKERLKREVQTLAPVGTRPKVHDPNEREYTVWTGGSILASLGTFQRMMISKEQYEEQGSRIIHIKSQFLQSRRHI